MAELGLVLPVLPGKRLTLQAFADALAGERRVEYELSQASVIKESWFLQPTPHGDLLLVHFEAPDPSAVLTALAVSEEPFDVWFREQTLDITGVDLTQPMPGLPERIFHWART
ncbi:MAG: hypothetical protein NT023_24170 [Armatimonadetes bacterium]|nr:hypothetical protein [Armatimonadota bacterium]